MGRRNLGPISCREIYDNFVARRQTRSGGGGRHFLGQRADVSQGEEGKVKQGEARDGEGELG